MDHRRSAAATALHWVSDQLDIDPVRLGTHAPTTSGVGFVARNPGLQAATALVHGLTLVARNTADLADTEVAMLNPFVAARVGVAQQHGEQQHRPNSIQGGLSRWVSAQPAR